MNTSSRFIVATHILAVLAGKRIGAGRDEAVKSDKLSESVNTNPVVVRRILGKLRDAGLVYSQKGPIGGSILARDPEKITLLDIYEAVDEADLFHLHYKEPNCWCPVGANIQNVMCDVLKDANAAMKQTLANKTLAEIAEAILERSGINKMLASGMTVAEIENEFMRQMDESDKKVMAA